MSGEPMPPENKKKRERRRYFSIPEVASLLGMSRVAIYKKVKNGEIPAIKLGRTYAISSIYVRQLLGKGIGQVKKKQIDRAVKRVISEYGELLRMLGKE
jgi:excisionase family DNA binding protein